MEELLNTKWKSTRVGTDPLKGKELQDCRNQLGNEWETKDDLKLWKNFKFNNFSRALEFANQVGVIADDLNHHPDLHIAWGKCLVEIWTHRINGLAFMDFVYAAKIEKIYQDKFASLLPKS